MNRRDLIAVTATVPVVAALPAMASPHVGPIETRLIRFRERSAAINDGYDNIPADRLDWMNAPLDEAMAMIPATMREFAALTLLGFMDERFQTADGQQEALFDQATAILGETV